MLVIATKNLEKLREITEILSNLKLEIHSLKDYPDFPEIVEDGRTYEENALKKARIVFEHTKLPTISDDSGLEVFALNMRPGIYSARYASENTSYELNNHKLLKEMEQIPEGKRQARFKCIIIFKTPNAEVISEGICNGKIITQPRGIGGFGYDPLFVPEGYSQTFAELPQKIKNSISHRGIALNKLRVIIKNYFQLFT